MTAQKRGTQAAFIPAPDADDATTGPMQEPRPSEATDPKKVAKAGQRRKDAPKKTPSKGKAGKGKARSRKKS